jgi:hypothetical protein
LTPQRLASSSALLGVPDAATALSSRNARSTDWTPALAGSPWLRVGALSELIVRIMNIKARRGATGERHYTRVTRSQ